MLQKDLMLQYEQEALMIFLYLTLFSPKSKDKSALMPNDVKKSINNCFYIRGPKLAGL